MSLGNRSVNTNISKTHLQKIYKINRIYPYKAKFCHTLEEGDEARRLQFCLSFRELILANRNFHKSIFFSNESTFTTNGVPSSQNCRYWSEDNLYYVINARKQYFKKVNIWCILSYELGIIGPFFIEERLNQYSYLQILQRFIDEFPLNQSHLNHLNSLISSNMTVALPIPRRLLRIGEIKSLMKDGLGE